MSDVYEQPIYAMVRSLRANQLPRNRHFDAHAGADGAAARRIHRFLRGVERDLRLATRIELADSEGGQRLLTLELGPVRVRRVVALSPTEFSILAENAENAAFLSRGRAPRAPTSD